MVIIVIKVNMKNIFYNGPFDFYRLLNVTTSLNANTYSYYFRVMLFYTIHLLCAHKIYLVVQVKVVLVSYIHLPMYTITLVYQV